MRIRIHRPNRMRIRPDPDPHHWFIQVLIFASVLDMNPASRRVWFRCAQVLRKKWFQIDATFDVNKCLKQITLPISLHMCASYSDLPFDKRTMCIERALMAKLHYFSRKILFSAVHPFISMQRECIYIYSFCIYAAVICIFYSTSVI